MNDRDFEPFARGLLRWAALYALVAVALLAYADRLGPL